MVELTTNRERYLELIKIPLLFLHKEEPAYNENGVKIRDGFWASVDKDYRGITKIEELKGNRLGYELVVCERMGDEVSIKQEAETKVFSFVVRAIDSSRLEDWLTVFKSFIERSRNPEDKYSFIYLLWMLENRRWNGNAIVNALKHFNNDDQLFIIDKGLCRICRCLAVNKQRQMKDALGQLGVDYKLYEQTAIIEAVNSTRNRSVLDLEDRNVFALVDCLMNDDYGLFANKNDNNNNPFLSLCQWLESDEADVDYSILYTTFALSSHDIQMNIVKRYLHDVRLGKTTVDSQLLAQFKDGQYSEFIRYRYCLFTPEERINLSVPLLCDCLLTLLETGGSSFQSFEGILDFVVTHCDVTKPNVKLGMEEFLPQCDGGAVCNKSFKGFIDYELVCELDESAFNDEKLKASIRSILDQKSHHKTYDACGNDEQKRPLTDDDRSHCFSTITIKEEGSAKGTEKRRFGCPIKLPYPDKWVVSLSDYKWLNMFLREPMPEVSKQDENKTADIDFGQTSTQVMANSIRSLVCNFEQLDGNRFVLPSFKAREYNLLLQYSRIVSCRIIPKSRSVIGIEYDVFGVKKAIYKEKNLDMSQPASDAVKEEFNRREAAMVRGRVVESLKTELKEKDFSGDFFEIPYDRDLLINLLGLYYYNYRGSSLGDYLGDEQVDFLNRIIFKEKQFIPFCAPRLSETHNKATDLPFFWCRGKECFHNNLSNQTLAQCSSWRYYSLYHMIEILGYPKIRETEAGYEPDTVVIAFIACANKVVKKFRHLKCRNCGHLLYTHKDGAGFDLHNYYSCINPTCSEFHVPIYLSYCFNCKSGLIDSRDSAKCPNGWHICPDCHSCCDDALYERLAQRYVIIKKTIPLRVRQKMGQGHNDKGIYFCSNCGTQVETKRVQKRLFGLCPTCNCNFEIKKHIEWFGKE